MKFSNEKKQSLKPKVRYVFLMLTYLTPIFIFSGKSTANVTATPNMPLSHCYHWLDQRTKHYLDYKYSFAAHNNGEFSFYTDGANGAAAGAGIYCAKTPITSTEYGDRVIRIDFVPDVVETDVGGQHFCGYDGNFYPNKADCDAKSEDMHLYRPGIDWYVIRNPAAIKSWSANDNTLIADLENNKRGADVSIVAHLDLAIQAMKAEIAATGQKTYLNGNARLSLDKILKDKSKMEKIPPFTLITMVQIDKSVGLSDSAKKQLYNEQLKRAMKDSLLTYADFDNALTNNSELKPLLKNQLSDLKEAHIDDINLPVALILIDKLQVDMNESFVKVLWGKTLSSESSLETILATGFSENSIYKKLFSTSLPPAGTLLAQIKEVNYLYMLKLLDALANPTGPNLQAYVEGLLEKALKGNRPNKLIDVFTALKNPSLDKENALAACIENAAKNKFEGIDPLAAGVLIEKTGEAVRSKLAKYGEQLATLPLPLTTQLSYALLNDYKKGKLHVPATISQNKMLLKIVDRSIRERSLGTNTTNTYRLILSGLYSFFTKSTNDQVNAETNQDDSSQTVNPGVGAAGYQLYLQQQIRQLQAHARHGRQSRSDGDNSNDDETSQKETEIRNNSYAKASEFFSDLITHLKHPNDLSYAYAALQNASAFANRVRGKANNAGSGSDPSDSDGADQEERNSDRSYVYAHPIYKFLKDYQKGNPKIDSHFESIISTSLDTSVLVYLTQIARDSNNDKGLQDKATDLLKSTLEYLTSNDLKNYIESQEFKVSQAEKKLWKNAGIRGTKNPSDFCSYIDTFNEISNNLRSITGDTTEQAARSLKQYQADICK